MNGPPFVRSPMSSSCPLKYYISQVLHASPAVPGIQSLLSNLTEPEFVLPESSGCYLINNIFFISLNLFPVAKFSSGVCSSAVRE
jgi:hypothetical protein